MKIKIIFSLITLGLFIQCKDDKLKKSETKIEKITAENNYNFIEKSSLTFQLFSDSSYIFTINQKSESHEKLEKFNDFCYSKNDTIYFSRTRFRFNGSEKAIIKNNFIEFLGGDFPLKIEIKKNLLRTENKLNLQKYNDYAFFTFESEFHKRYFHNKPNTIKSADLNQNELIEMDQILKRCFDENNSKLRKFKEYKKQCIVILNENQEKEIWIGCYCADPYQKNEYKYSLIDMNDGGNCNISVRINLTNHNYLDLSISGRA